MVSLILQKNERKQFDLMYHSSKVEFFRSFFRRIQETINLFRDLLIFSAPISEVNKRATTIREGHIFPLAMGILR